MDVRCERCKTEYELDDARVSEAGVAVKCTTCSHVFKVKKKALLVTVAMSAEEAASLDAGAAKPTRDWKVRQANGNVFTCKELTTLQKWIVERKVSRDDEISLTGDTWKRLGNIAELASFFQVVEDAQRAQAFTGDSATKAAPTLGPERNTQVEYAAAVGQRSTAAVTPASVKKPEQRRRPSRWLLFALPVAILGGSGYSAYEYYWRPLDLERRQLAAKVAREREDLARAEQAERGRVEREQTEKEWLEKEQAERARVVASAVPDAGAPEPKRAPIKVVKPVVHDFDYYLAQAERLLQAENPEAALEAYGKAADLKPERAEPIAGTGLALLDMGNKVQAEATLLRALKMNPRYGVALMGLAETYRSLDRKAEAIRYYHRYLEVLPEGPEAQVARAALKKLAD